MTTNRILLFIGISTLAMTAGCSSNTPDLEHAQYWQRSTVYESIYMNGTKAQEMLNRDIARCVTELKELERLGQLDNPVPTDDKQILSKVDTPERDGYLFAEHKNYTNFESCMDHAGWERTSNITPETAERSRRNFFANHVSFKDLVPKFGSEGKVGLPKAEVTEDDYEYNN